MRFELTVRHFTIPPSTRALIEERMTRTLRRLDNRALSAHVVLTRERARIQAEITLHAGRERFLHGTATDSTAERAFDAAMDRIEGQARTLKGKRATRTRRVASAVKAGPRPAEAAAGRREAAEAPARRRIIRTRRAAVKPMSIEDAAAEMSDGRDVVIVFRNASTDAVTVLFRRPDGHIGLIEPDA